jgi:hypothetical protein
MSVRNALVTIVVTWLGIGIAATLYGIWVVARVEVPLWLRRRACERHDKTLAGEHLIAEIRLRVDGVRTPLRMVGKK